MRFTKKDKMARYGYKYVAPNRFDNFGEGCNKLGQLEDLMEKYDIKTLSQVEGSFIGFVTDYTEEGRNHIGQLLKLENDLGIDLIILFKAYTNGFYVKGEETKQYIDFENPLNSIAFKNKEMFYGHEWSYQYVKLYDYGKTWALTKEELL